MARNPHCYGDVEFRLWNINKECGAAGARVTVAGIDATSDENGYIRLFIPLEKQSNRYEVKSDLPLESAIITMPTTRSRALRVLD